MSRGWEHPVGRCPMGHTGLRAWLKGQRSVIRRCGRSRSGDDWSDMRGGAGGLGVEGSGSRKV